MKARKVVVDGGFHGETGYGSIACVFEDGPPLSRVIQVPDSVRAELCAIREAMDEASNRGLGDRKVVFVCDCKAAVNSGRSPAPGGDGFIKSVRRALRHHPHWRLEWRPREQVKPAHHLAAIVYEAWLEGVRSADVVGSGAKGGGRARLRGPALA